MRQSIANNLNPMDLPSLIPSIRLLSFSSPKPQGSLLDFSLKVYAISSLPSYAAVSYCWGNPFPPDQSPGPSSEWELSTHQAKCNGDTIYLRRNLHEALQHLRTLENLPESLWVDTICINQNDDNERSAQVSLMSDIYGRADVVLGWLGPRNSSAETAHTFIRTFGKAVLDLIEERGLHKVITYSPKSQKLFQKINQKPPQEADWRSWNELFQRTWFSRTWILQEASLAKRLVLMCGELEFEFEMLQNFNVYSERAAWWPMRAPDYAGEILPGQVLVPIINTRGMVWRTFESEITRNYVRGPHGAISQGAVLLRLLILSRGSFASNLLDKIYGLLGILKRIFGESYVQIVAPDYSINVEQLYIKIASFFITSVPILSLLTNVEDATNRQLPTLPSWVPDFSTKHGEGAALRFGFILNTEDFTPLYKACILEGTGSIPTTRTIENNVLTIRGIRVGQIPEVSSLMPHITSTAEIYSQLSVLAGLPSTYINGETLLETFLKTSLGDRTPCGQVSPDGITLMDSFVARLLYGTLWRHQDCPREDYRKEKERYLRFLCSLEGSVSASMLVRLRIPALNSIIKDISEFISLCTDFKFRSELHEALLEHSILYENNADFAGRVLFRTDNNYLGRGPLSSQVNDEVWLLEQSRAPFVLRPVPGTDCHRLVGECYVHGIMQGELADPAKFVTVRLS